MRCIFNATTFFQLKMNIYFRLQSHSRQNFINIESDVDHKKGGQGGFEPPTSRTQSENHTSRPLARIDMRKDEARGIRTPNLRVWNPTRCHCAIASHLRCGQGGPLPRGAPRARAFHRFLHAAQKGAPHEGFEPSTPRLEV